MKTPTNVALTQLMFITLFAVTGLQDGADDRVLTGRVTGNHLVLLTHARISESRGQNLEGKLTIIGGERAGEVISVRFPAHSHTTHETTLMNIIRASIDWSPPESRYQWHEAGMPAVLSVPTGAQGSLTEYDQWWFVRFESKD